ncbi:MAG: hypothetical protein JSV69_12670 [Chloroflexota bacterium]|nr:MAG: hypothetical protein JSV69_12670 [Chloroflexota bacterium]
MINNLPARKPAKLSRQLLAIVLGSISAIVANVVYYFILKDFVGIEFIAPEESPPPEVSPLPATDVVIFSIIFSAGASILFLILASTVRRPALIFVTISLVVLVLSLFLPLFMPTPPIPLSTELSLASMHILGAAVLVPVLAMIGLPINTMNSEEV